VEVQPVDQSHIPVFTIISIITIFSGMVQEKKIEYDLSDGDANLNNGNVEEHSPEPDGDGGGGDHRRTGQEPHRHRECRHPLTTGDDLRLESHEQT
jgi:hypothetical protein